MNDDQAKMNTDRELWRETPGDYYSPRLFVTEGGGIGIDVGGYVTVLPLRNWHSAARACEKLPCGHVRANLVAMGQEHVDHTGRAVSAHNPESTEAECSVCADIALRDAAVVEASAAIAGGSTGDGNTVEQAQGYSDACRDIKKAIRALKPDAAMLVHNLRVEGAHGELHHWGRHIAGTDCGDPDCPVPKLLEAERAKARLEEAKYCATRDCRWCAGDSSDITVQPQKIEEQYIPNCGVMAGWVHHRSWGGFVDCDAPGCRDRIAALEAELARDAAEGGKG